MGGWLKNTGKAALAINNSIYLLRLFKVTVSLLCAYIQTYSQVHSIKVHSYTLFLYLLTFL